MHTRGTVSLGHALTFPSCRIFDDVPGNLAGRNHHGIMQAGVDRVC